MLGEEVEEQFLRTVGVDRAEPDRQHELGRFERDLQRPEIREAKLGLFTEVDLRDEEFHALFEITLQDCRGALWDAVAVLGQPDFQAAAFLARENEDVVFTDRILRLHGYAQGLVTFTWRG